MFSCSSFERSVEPLNNKFGVTSLDLRLKKSKYLPKTFLKSFEKFVKLLETFGLLDKVVEIGGTYLENFEFVKAVIERYYNGI